MQAIAKVRMVAYVIAVIGLLLSVYLTLVHYTSVPLACPQTGLINCQSVLTSKYAMILGIPVAVLGLVFFIGEFFAIKLYLGKDPMISYNIVGIAFVAYFLYSEYMVGHICEYCTSVHICVLALLIISVWGFGKGSGAAAVPTASS